MTILKHIRGWRFVSKACVLTVIVTLPLYACHAGAQTIVVPLKIDGAKILTNVRLNGKNARLLLDTGAALTFITPELANGALELQRVNIQQHAGVSRASLYRINITVGDVVFHDHIVAALDMKDVNQRTGMQIDGVLGEDILGRFRSVRINFKDKRLELEQ
jgi:hypothetical protein